MSLSVVVSIALVHTKCSRPVVVDPTIAGAAPDEPSLVAFRERQVREAPNMPVVAGLDLVHITLDDKGASAPAPTSDGSPRVAHLTLDTELQRTALALMSAHRLPEAAVVMMDTTNGNVLVYASHIDKGTPRDLCAEATAPAASVFKIVTGSTLVEDAHLTPETKQCYSGGAERITAQDLVDDPHKDKWCATLSGAMGRSLNTIFARLAQKNLKPDKLELFAHRFGFGEAFSFDVPVQPSIITMPKEDQLEFARTSAGFWNSTLSPLHAAELSAIVARGGEGVRPVIVRDLVDEDGQIVYKSAPAPALPRSIAQETAAAVTTMMEHTVSEGTSFKAFHDTRGTAFLPNITIAGKTGTLTDPVANRYYTWFTGFAPSKPSALPVRPVAIAVLVVNLPSWQIKANVVARDMLRAYFAQHQAPSVSKPSAVAVARHKEKR